MYDIDWCGDDCELVGERRARKEREKTEKKLEEFLSSGSSNQTTPPRTPSLWEQAKATEPESPRDVRGRTIEKPSSWRRMRLKKGSTCATNHNVDPPPQCRTFMSTTTSVQPPSSYLRVPTMPTPPSSACADVRSPAPSLASAKEQVQDDMALASGNEPRSFPRETKNFDFVVSRSADGYSDINYKSVTLSRLAQCLGQGSWITRTVELRVEPNTIGLSEPQSEVKVAALWGFAGMMEPPSTLRQRYTKPCLRSVEPYSAHASAHLGTTSPIVEADSVIKPIDSKRGPVSMTNTYNSKAWKAPTEWASNLTKASESMICGIPSSTDREQEDPANLNLGSMLREIKKMATATPEIALFRLREDWETVEDPVLRKELEMEKKRWMLSVIFRADIMGKSENHPLEKMKILFLFEPRAVATFLAALYHDCEITDISPAPLSQKMYPNVRPVIKPMLPVASALPLALGTYDAIYSLSLPSLMPSKDIPAMLHSIASVLIRRGVLYLTLLDPAPVAASVGPRMRRWLDERLLLPAERGFRCTRPTSLVPLWLAEAHLMAEGSNITTVRFQAVATINPSQPKVTQPPSKAGSDELRSTAGVLLWREIWGDFVSPGTWWWEDAECLDECLSLGTYWEYSLVEAIKES